MNPRPFPPREITIHLARAEDAGDPYAFPYRKGHYGAFTYLRTHADGTSESAEFAWDEALFSDLAGLRSPTPDPARLPSFGHRLHDFLDKLGWNVDEGALGDPSGLTHITLELGAAELFVLPWEAVETSAGERIGKLQKCLIRYAWSGTLTAPRTPDPAPEDGRILVAWSAGGKGVPHDEHLEAIQCAYREGDHPEVDRNVIELPDLSLKNLGEALMAHAPVHVLHLVCHGAAVESNRAIYGLRLRTADGAGYETVDPERIGEKLKPFAGSLRLVVLCACHGGDAGAIDSRLGSIALSLHRIGIPAVVASRYPLSWSGSNLVAEALYQKLLGERTSLEEAFLAARARLVSLSADEGNVDWASLQLYARSKDGPDHRPIVIRPYRGLLAFQKEHARYFCGRKAEIEEAVTDLEKLVNAKDTQNPRFLVVTGASGTGKSSLVLAGVVPELQKRDPRWLVPLALRPTLDWKEKLEAVLAMQRAPDARLLLVVDQFEETFTVLPDKNIRREFVQALWDLCQDPASGISVIATLRVDFLGRCGEIDLDGGAFSLERIVYDESHRVFVSRMAQAEMRAIIEEPAAAVGLELDAGLTAQILADAGDEPGALPLVQYALDELWKSRKGRRLSRETYDELGGIAGALVKKAGALIEGFDDTRRRAARRMLVQLVDAREDAALDTRRRVRRDELRRGPEAEAAVFDEVLDTLARERLLVVSGEKDASTVEVAHEELIRRFEKLREWVRADRTMLAELAQLATWVEEATKYEQVLDGKKLGYARVLLGNYKSELDPRAIGLIERSEAAETRGKRRARLLAGAGVLVAILMGVLAFVAYGGQVKYQRTAEREAAAAVAARDTALVSGARELLARDQAGAATRLLIEVQRPDTTPGFAQIAVDVLSARFPTLTLQGHQGRVNFAAWSSDGKRIATTSVDGIARVWELDKPGNRFELKGLSTTQAGAPLSPDGKRFATLYPDGAIRVWELDGSGKFLDIGKHDGVVFLGWSPDGKRIVTTSAYKTARIWEVDGSHRYLELKGAIGHAAWSPGGKRLLTEFTSVDVNWSARVWELDGSGQFLELEGHDDTMMSAAFSPDGNRVAIASINKAPRVWELDGSGKFLELEGHSTSVLTLAWSPDGKRIVTTSMDREARIWRLDDLSNFVTLKHEDSVVTASWSADGKRVITASSDKTARVWDVDGKAGPVLKGHRFAVNAASFSPDGKRIVTVSDKLAYVWDLDGAFQPVKLPGRINELSSAVFSPDQKRVVAVERFGSFTALVWELDHPEEEYRELKGPGSVFAIAWSPNGRHVAVSYSLMSTAVRVWDLDHPDTFTTLDGHKSGVTAMAFSPDGRRLVVAPGKPSLLLWDLETTRISPQQLEIQDRQQNPIHGLAWNPDGKRIAAGFAGQPVRVWQLDGSGNSVVSQGPEGDVKVVAWSPDGRNLLAVYSDNAALVWELEGSLSMSTSTGTAAPEHRVSSYGTYIELKGHDSGITFAAWSPDGKSVVTTAEKTARVWKLDGSSQFLELKGQEGIIKSAAFTADGERILTVTSDGYVRTWYLTTTALVRHLREATTDCLSPEMNQIYFGDGLSLATERSQKCERSRGRTP